MGHIRERAEAKRAALRAVIRARHPSLRQKVQPVAVTPADPTALVLGRNDRGVPVLLPAVARLQHAHFIGTTGGGKTKHLEHCLRQDIANGYGVCAIDPDGNHPDSLYRSLLGWLD